MSSIAALYGFADYKKIYEASENEALRKKRPDPHVVREGDEVVIPDVERKTVSLATGKVHKFVVSRPKRRLRLKLAAPGDPQFAGQEYVLSVGDLKINGKVGSGNLIDEEVPPTARQAVLFLKTLNLRLELDVGGLDPSHDDDSGEAVATGLQARLGNLGFDCGAVDGNLGPKTTDALKRFQAKIMKQDSPTGEADANTSRRLRDEHGC